MSAGSSSALVEPRATTDIDLLLLIEQPTREGIQSLLSSQFDSTLVYSAPMVFHGISIWRVVGIRGGQDVVVDLLLADSHYLKTALSRRRMVVLGELNVPILAIEDLIVLKTLAVAFKIKQISKRFGLARMNSTWTGAMSRNGKLNSIFVGNGF